MRKFTAISAALVLAGGSTAFAQTLLDDFEVDIAGWASSTNAFTVLSHVTDDGADGTTSSLQVSDAGWTKGAEKEYVAIAPADGNYYVTFYFKNGHTGNPWPGLGVRLDGAHSVNLGSDPVTTWTQSQTGVIALTTTDDLNVEIFGTSNAQADNNARFDEFYLVEATSIPIEGRVSPSGGKVIAGTASIEVFPTGGTGNFTEVQFQVNGFPAHTDDTPGDGFTWEFDTTGEPDGTVDITVIIEDDASDTGIIELSWVIDNDRGRTGNLVDNGDFESWDAGLPTGWTVVNLDGAGNENAASEPVIFEETDNPFAGNSALGLEYATQPDPYRYALLSNAFPADRFDYQIWFAARGNAFVRLYFFQTTDGGATWVNTFNGALPGAGSVWTDFIHAPYDPGTESRPDNLAIATHYFGTGTGFWDEVYVDASIEEWEEPATDVEQWDLYH